MIMPEALNPWSSGQAIDTRRLFDDFGIEPIDPLLDLLPAGADAGRCRVAVRVL